MALATFKNPRRCVLNPSMPPICCYCKKENHIIENCYKLKNKKKNNALASPMQNRSRSSPYAASTLNFPTHMQVDPNGSQDAPTLTTLALIPEQYTKLLALISSGASTPKANIACMLQAYFSILFKLQVADSRATDHMVSDSSLLTSSTALDSLKKVTLFNEKEADITHIGTTKLNSSLSINYVLCIPSFQNI